MPDYMAAQVLAAETVDDRYDTRLDVRTIYSDR